jgi:ABC-type branched-chain amino acid transport system, permease component
LKINTFKSMSPYIATFAFLTALPFFLNEYEVSIVFTIMLYIVLASSWNLPGGYGGQYSFGHYAFIGIGAYTAAILVTLFHVNNYWGFYSILGIVAGATASCVLAALIAFISLPLRGAYFTIATLASAELMRFIVENWTSVTRGPYGIELPVPPKISLVEFPTYFFMLALLIISFIITFVIDKSSFGLALKAIKQDESLAEVCGVNVKKYRLLIFMIGGALAGAAGALFAYNTEFINPTSAFDVTTNIEMIFMTILGGAGTFYGPFIGGVILSLLDQLVLANFPYIHLLVVGIVLILFVLLLPEGIPTIINRLERKEIKLNQTNR